MSSVEIYGAAAALSFGLAVYGAIAARPVIHKLVSLNVMGASVFLLLVAASARPPAAPDPVPHAMVITGIVVTVAATGYAVALIRRMEWERGSGVLPEDAAPGGAASEQPGGGGRERGEGGAPEAENAAEGPTEEGRSPWPGPPRG